MTHRDDLDRLLSVWLDDPYTPPAPRYLGQVLERTRHTRQRPAWASLERGLPMADNITRPAGAMPMRIAVLLLIALLVAALVAGAAVIGSRLLDPTRQDNAIPQGGSAVFVFSSIDSSAGGDIYLARADGTDLRRLTSGPGTETSPTWSPDGTHVAYRVWEGGVDSIVVMDAGGGNAITLATTDATARYCARGGMAWSPDGTSLIFPTSPDCDSRFDQFIVAADGSSPATRLVAQGTDNLFAEWSPDGRHVAFVGSDAAGNIGYYIVEVGPGRALAGSLETRRVFPGPVGPFNNLNSGPRWSPDGSELAVVSETGDVLVVQADGSEPRVVAEAAFNPAWSPDGRRIAFHRTVDPSEYFQGRPCTARTWVVDAEGTNERRLDPLVEGCAPPPEWSPDGTRLAGLLIVTTPDDPNLAFHYGVILVDGSGTEVALQDGGAGSWQPVVAPLPPTPSLEAPAPTP